MSPAREDSRSVPDHTYWILPCVLLGPRVANHAWPKLRPTYLVAFHFKSEQQTRGRPLSCSCISTDLGRPATLLLLLWPSMANAKHNGRGAFERPNHPRTPDLTVTGATDGPSTHRPSKFHHGSPRALLAGDAPAAGVTPLFATILTPTIFHAVLSRLC